MSTWIFEVGGTVVRMQQGWSLQLTSNGRNRFVGKVFSLDGSVRPALDATVLAIELVTIAHISTGNPTIITTTEPHGLVTGRFVGVSNVTGSAPDINGYIRCTVLSPTQFSIPIATTAAGTGGTAQRQVFYGDNIDPLESAPGTEGIRPIVTQTTAVSMDARTEHRYVNEVLLAGTLKAQLMTLVAHYLPGIVVDENQVDGPVLGEMPCAYVLLRDVLDAMAQLAGGYVWEVDPYGRARMFLPSSEQAPFDVTEGGRVVVGDLTTEPTRTAYANRVILEFTSAAIAAYAFLGATANFSDTETVVIGSKTYTFLATLTDADGHVQIGADLNTSLGNLVAAINLAGGAGASYATSTTKNTQVFALQFSTGGIKVTSVAAGASGNSIGVSTTSAHAHWYGEGNVPLSTLAQGADAALTSQAIAEDLGEQAAHGIWEAVVSAAEITDYGLALASAQTYLAVHLLVPKTVTYTTLGRGLVPGQRQTINFPSRHINDVFLITDVNLTNRAGSNLVQYAVTAIESLVPGSAPQWRDVYKQWSSGSGSVAAITAAVGVGPGGGGGGGGIAGSGTPGRIVKWTSGPALADAVLFEAGGNIGLNTTTPGTFQGGGGSTGTVFQVQSATSHAQFVASAKNPGALAAMNFEVGDAIAGRRVIQQFYHGPTNALRWRVLNETNGAVVLSDVLALMNTGNVGIGTVTPVAPLDVVGRLRLTGAPPVVPTSGVGIEMAYDSTNAIGKLLAYDRNGGAYKPMNVEGNPLGLNVQSGANVGIGTATPTYRVHVVSGGGGVISQVQGVTNPRFNVSDGAVTADVYVVSGTAQFGSVTTTPVNINTNDTVAIHVDTSQRVGLGTTAPLTFQLELTADVGPHTPFSGNIGHLTQKWASVYAGELHVETLVAQQTITTIGGRAVIASGGNVVTALVGVPDGFIFFKYNSLQTGDVIVFEGPDATGAYSTEFMQVIGAPTGAGPFLYQVTRNYGGAFTAHSWPAGAACMNTGQTGAGFIDLYSINSLKGPSEVGPTIVGNLRTSNAYNDWKPRWAIGNLNGLYGYTTNLFGVAIGVPAGTNITIEASNGILIRTGTVPVFSVDTAGNMRLSGNLTMSTNGIFSAGAATTFAAGTGWWLDYNSGTPRFRVGNPSGDQIAWDGVNLSVRASNLTVDTTGVTVAVTTAYQAARAYRFSTGFGSTNNFGLFGLETGTTRQLTLQNTTGVGNNVYVSLLAQNGNGYFAQLNLVAASTSTSAALQSSYIQLVGNVGVNTQTASSVPLTVYNLATGWAMAITAGVFNGAGLYIAAGQSSQEIIQAWFQANVTTLQGIVYGDGNWLKNNTSVWSILSDRTIKKNVVPLTGALDRIRRVQLHEFEYNGVAGTLTDEHGVGVIAQDIQPIFPRSVTTVQIPNIHNPLLKTTALGFNAHELFMNGIGAIIELDQRVAALTARLAALEQR